MVLGRNGLFLLREIGYYYELKSYNQSCQICMAKRPKVSSEEELLGEIPE